MNSSAAHKFAFGKNWEKFSDTVTEDGVAKAVADLSRLMPDGLAGKSFLDIGSGSGLHSLAALRLGASRVSAFDADEDSVRTTQKMVEGTNVSVERKDILKTVPSEKFEVVYSWGVLHHTGDMWTAIKNAAGFVKPHGKFIIAIYKKTPMCGFWRMEKEVYSQAPAFLQAVLTAVYSLFYLTGVTVSGQNPIRYVRDYNDRRGMNFWHDMIDWLGGYPYESASPEEIENFMKREGFKLIAKFNAEPCKASGLFGSGCAEYVFEHA